MWREKVAWDFSGRLIQKHDIKVLLFRLKKQFSFAAALGTKAAKQEIVSNLINFKYGIVLWDKVS